MQCSMPELTAPGMCDGITVSIPGTVSSRLSCSDHYAEPVAEGSHRRSPAAAGADAGPVYRRRVERRRQGPGCHLSSRHALPRLPRHLLDRHEPSRASGAVRPDEPPRRLGLRAGLHAAGRHGAVAPRAPRAALRPGELHAASCVRRARLHAAIRPLLQQRADDARSGRDSASGRRPHDGASAGDRRRAVRGQSRADGPLHRPLRDRRRRRGVARGVRSVAAAEASRRAIATMLAEMAARLPYAYVPRCLP